MNSSIKVKIEKLIPGGKGLCRIDGKVVFVPFVLPGEIVEISIVSEKKNFSEALLLEVHESSPDRIKPLCSHYLKCGGCNLQHMNYKTQLRVKKEFAENLLQRNADICLPEFDIVPSTPFQYRNRVQVHVEGNAKGFKERAGNRVIPISHCPIAAEGINSYLASKCIESDIERITVFGENDWFSPEYTEEDISICINGKNINFRSDLFFQSNISILPELSDYLNTYVVGDTLLDLYCGVGLLSSMVEDQFTKIHAVEINKNVAPYIKRNVTTDCDFYPTSLEKWISTGNKIKADTIIIDPPRTGLSKSVRKFLNNSNAEVILYVSCDPATMTRDLKEITADNYKIDNFKLFDFYPQTSHMEAVAVLRKES